VKSPARKIWQYLYEVAAFSACFLLIWLMCATLKTCSIFAQLGVRFENNTVAHIIPAAFIMMIVLAVRLGQKFLTTQSALAKEKQARKVLHQQFCYDAETGLPNRCFVDQQLQYIAQGQAQNDPQNCILIALQFDHLEAIEVTHGKGLAAEVVEVIAARLRRVSGAKCIARIETNRFLIALDPDQNPDVDLCLKKISSNLRSPISVSATAFQFDCAFGVSNYTKDSTNLRICVEFAEDALEHGLKDGPNGLVFFTPQIAQMNRDEAALEMQLRDAVMQDELSLHFQPFYNMATGEVAGFEALARWTTENGENIPPDRFIPLIDKLGLGAEMSYRLFQRALREAKNWPDHTMIAFNICGSMLEEAAIVDRFIGIAANEKVSLSRIEFEVTESRLIGDCVTALENIKRLRDLGAKISLDDLGTGYSSLLRLSHIDIDKVKIDREFTRRMLEDPRTAKIVAGMVSLARELDIAVAIEGIETEEHLARARALRCNFVQGYLMGRPRDAAAAQSLMNKKSIQIALPQDEAKLAV
jgi:predicted signal transduction protein with EAL and GGDEF domain